MSDVSRQRLCSTFNFLGGVGGLISLATIVFYGGNLVAQVNSLERRVSIIEGAGPATLQSHIALDEQRYVDHERRIEMTEKLLPSMDRKLDQILKKP